MSFFQALIMAILQGATELFPVSSLGHAVILPSVLHWAYDPHDATFLPFLVMLHLGTSVALLIYFSKDWAALIRGVLGFEGQRIQLESFHIFWLLAVATIPAVVVGGLFEHLLRSVFGSASSAAGFLFLNGLLLLLSEKLRGSVPDREVRCIAALTSRDAVVIGLFQCLAFFPGLSRSGATICGGLLRGLHHDAAARFSFLMAQPVILAATVREAFKMRHIPLQPGQMHIALIAAVVSAITALVSTAFLMRYFRDHDNWAMTPFAVYCMGAGAAAWCFLHFAI
ncbi:undecaprenyl-diphosphate phosphatase [Acetobacter sp. TBRC 12305]|uniref:Undecaprenyl-diphosphatase n=1 Tax=Acetobacter garciniae TaxID=2817435 RepID=A0A939HGU3_9PROT|nr:undecaprenyl-diphosphate phosphatase [Acetobacter garciniae]MBO1324125.1 undecaprenyl-diphosphate phosphatase [Acetobacter garciniae]MBX0343814.1 undecaprenyl-diphosphate phosphatase [Acetobacter garciniae]